MRSVTVVLAALVGLGLALAPAAVAAPVAVDDPADTSYGAPDVLAVAADSDATGTLSVVTRFAPRPPAGWGLCVPFVPGSPSCFPLDMRVDWFLDAVPGAGSLADEGADARVTAVPTRGQSVMELARFDVTRGWVTGPVPGLTQTGGSPTLDLGWQAAFASLGIAPGSAVAIRVVSRYRTFTGLGTPLVYEDRAPDAGGLQVTLAGVPAGSGPPPDPACKRAATAVNRRPGRPVQGAQAIALQAAVRRRPSQGEGEHPAPEAHGRQAARAPEVRLSSTRAGVSRAGRTGAGTARCRLSLRDSAHLRARA